MSPLKQILIRRLEDKGIGLRMIPGFIRTLANAFLVYPHMNLPLINKHLQYGGWGGIELDYYTLQLAVACLEADGLKSTENKPARWFDAKFNSAAA